MAELLSERRSPTWSAEPPAVYFSWWCHWAGINYQAPAPSDRGNAEFSCLSVLMLAGW